MARKVSRLTAVTIKAAKQRGYYADSGNLYLQVSAFGTKSWIFRYLRRGKLADMGLGPLHTVTLAEARQKATAYRKLLIEGIDPKDARDEQREQARLRREVCDVRTVRRCLRKGASRQVDERQARRPMVRHTEHIRFARVWIIASAGSRHGACL